MDDDSAPPDRRTGARTLASGKSPNPGGGLVGRDTELSRIRALLAEAHAGRSGALLVEGAPGIGKTTLLDFARTQATGFTCLAATGVESESVLAHAGLLELLNPVRDLLGEVADPQAAALGSALGWRTPEVPADRFLVAAATLSILAAAAATEPVLVVVDDLQWLDAETVAAILFAARRLGPDPVAFLFAARTAPTATEGTRGLPVLRLTGLQAPEAARLVPPGVSASVVDRLVAGTDGNPLALIEASSRLDPGQRVGAAPLPDPLPVGDRLQTHYAAVLSGLSADARRLLLLLAAAPGDPTAAASAFRRGSADLADAVDEASELGVLVVDERGFGFRHPLLRAAVLRQATPAQRRRAHRDIADVLPPGVPARAWHLAEAQVGADDRIADELTRVADADRSRLGFAAASAALERAALLSTTPDQATARLAAAAEDAFLAGDVTRTRALVARVSESSAPREVRGRALLVLGMLEQYAGSVPRSVEHLAAAADLLDGVQQVRALAELANGRFRLNQLDRIAETAARIDAAADPSDPEQRMLASFTSGVAAMLRGDIEAGLARLREVRALAVSGDLDDDPRAPLLLALAAGFSGEVAEAMAAGAARIDELRRRGALGVLVPSLAIRAAGRAWLGDHAGAFADAGEAAELAEQIDYAADAAVAVEMLAWQSAARGLHDDAAGALVRARELTDRAGTTSVAAHQALTAAFCALCRDDLARVTTLLEARIAADGGVGALGEPLGVAPLLVEAYVGLGRADDAVALTKRYAASTLSSAPAMTTALVARCLCLTAAEGSAADAAFADALDAHAAAGDPFEAARTQLLYGARTRRAGRRVVAREHLRAAHDAFVDMDLTHWARRAREELAATGATTRRRGPEPDEPLTSQETRVALLVAEGMSNREVAAALFLSPKTVERHLGSVFRKRGFRSRVDLARAHAQAPARE